MTDENKPSRLRTVYEQWIKPLAVTLTILFAVRSSIADWNDVPTQSMEPTILVGDRIFVNKLAYGFKVPFTTWNLVEWSAPKRGEIITFFSPKDDERMVKRVIGVPGDVVSMTNNQLVINGKLIELDESSAEDLDAFDLTDTLPPLFATEKLKGRPHGLMFQPTRPARRSFAPITVPEGQYLVMGDNRDNSADSRYFGFVPRHQILGRMVRVALSLDYDHHCMPRWDRFFRGVD